MTPLTSRIVGTALGAVGEEDAVSLEEIEGRLRAFGSGARDVVLGSKRNTIAAGAIGGIAAIAGAYLHGRRRGRKRATVLEVERR